MTRRKDAATENDLIGVGEIMRNDPLLKPPSRVEMRLIESSEDIQKRLPIREDISYQHTVLCQTGLPYRNTDERRWEARNGLVMLEVEAGRAFHPHKQAWFDLPLPFGPKARLILIYLNSEAIRTQDRVIEVEDSMTAFIRQLQNGRDPNGEEIQKFKDQMAALSAATIRLATAGEDTPEATQSLHGKLEIVENFDLWFPKNPSQRVLWQSTVELSSKYFQTLIRHAVPLDQRAIAALSHNARALDIYSWLAQRLHRIPSGRKQFVAWTNLYNQFGHGYKLVRQFRSNFIKTLKDVLTQYPEAKIEVTDGGLLLAQSPPPIHKRGVQITGSL